MKLSFFTMPIHPLGKPFAQSLAEDREAFILADKLGYAEAYCIIGRHYEYISGRLDEAVVWYAKGITLDPGNPRYSAWLGFHFLNLEIGRAHV